ncbi:MAG: zinc ABC transporter substrate-binding protein [Rhodobacteraceae bacterium]|nr:zinc ABC transporter substrate-binding protein [Paracoccaceae bacterium]
MRLILALLFIAQPLMAAPKVAATLPPIAGLVAEIMQGVATPSALIPANAEPHHFSLRPSQISALREADIVFAVGLDLEPWLARVEGSFAIINLAETASEPLPARNFDLSARAESDPHLWLDPGEMVAWELEITQRLIKLDPENADIYRANEFALLQTLVAAKKQLENIGERMNAEGLRLVVSHDAFQYLERRLDVPLVGMLSDYTEVRAGARSLSKISRLEGPICILEHPELSAPADLLPNAPRVMLDPMGADFAGAPNFSMHFYQHIVAALEGCLTPQ